MTYSDCVECGKAISSSRQIAIQDADTCSECEKKRVSQAISQAEKDFIAKQFLLIE
jgi:RNA polymerase-binding transcription factor DksA